VGLQADVVEEVSAILSETWDIRDGQVVPTTTDVALGGGGVRLNATILYADLADSTDLAMNYDRRVAAKVYKAFLASSSRIIRAFDGEIRSFDGDRVMGVFVGSYKNTTAAKVALKINFAVQNIIAPKLVAKYDSLRESGYAIKHGCGIDVSDVLVVRGGIRAHNDLLWVGRAPNVAAKLSNIRRADANRTFITADVYNKLHDEAKLADDGMPMWKSFTWDAVVGVEQVYGSTFSWGLG
jgi:adenylate cyclase